jgi:hypothetical protein
MGRINEMKDVIQDHCGTLKKMSYAGAVASQPKGRETLYLVIVTTRDETETSDQILGRIRSAINAKDGRMEVESVRRTKDRKVVVSCKTTH